MLRLRAALALAGALALAAGAARAETVDVRTLVPLLRAHAFAELETRIDALGASGARTRGGWLAQPRALFALGVASADDPAIGHDLAVWVDARPEAWAAHMASGWRAVVTGYLPRSAAQPFEGVEAPLQREPALRAAARASFARAAALAPRSPEPPAALLLVDLADGLPDEALERRLAEACAVDPRCETARAAMLVPLARRHGPDALLGFARQVAGTAPDDPNLGVLVAAAHRLAAAESRDPDAWFRQPGVFEESQRVLEAHLAAHPDATAHRHELARIACWADRRDVARAAFEAIGDDFREGAWQGRFSAFLTCRSWALADAPARAHAGRPAP